jgi:hypothetical protein
LLTFSRLAARLMVRFQITPIGLSHPLSFPGKASLSTISCMPVDDEIAILRGLSLLDLSRCKQSEQEPCEYGFHWPIL